jgi:hypothetical protein
VSVIKEGVANDLNQPNNNIVIRTLMLDIDLKVYASPENSLSRAKSRF